MKRSLSLLIALVFTISMLILPTNATTMPNDEDLKDHMLRILVSIEHEKEHYGLSNVEFSGVSIGKEIPTYHVQDQQLCSSDIHIYPIIYDNKIVSMFFSTVLPSGELYVQLGTELVPLVAPFSTKGSFAIIYDDLGINVFSDNSIIKVGDNPWIEQINENTQILPESSAPERTRQSVDSVDKLQKNVLSSIKTANLETSYVLNVRNYALASNNTSTRSGVYLPVDIETQGTNERICWAICATVIVNYIFDYNLDHSTIVDQFNNGVNSGLNTSAVIRLLNQYYNVNYAYVASGTPTITTILNSLSRGKPVYGDFLYTDLDQRHAVVIRGASSDTRTFSVMNPTPRTSGYTAGTVSSSNKWTFICAYSNESATLKYYGKYNAS